MRMPAVRSASIMRVVAHDRQLHLHPSFSFMNHSPQIFRDNHQPSRSGSTTNISVTTSTHQGSRAFPQHRTLVRPFSTAINRAMAAETAVKNFFTSPHFAVVGASSDPQKFGHKIFRWYLEHDLDVTPINPSAPSITALSPSLQKTSYDALPNLSALPHPKETSVSIITPPNITTKILAEAKSLGIEAVWLQPGTYNDEILQFVKKNFKWGIGGPGGGGGEGWCVLVDGDYGLGKAGKL